MTLTSPVSFWSMQKYTFLKINYGFSNSCKSMDNVFWKVSLNAVLFQKMLELFSRKMSWLSRRRIWVCLGANIMFHNWLSNFFDKRMSYVWNVEDLCDTFCDDNGSTCSRSSCKDFLVISRSIGMIVYTLIVGYLALLVQAYRFEQEAEETSHRYSRQGHLKRDVTYLLTKL